MTEEKRGFSPTRSELYNWLDTQTHGVLSTIGKDGFPNAAYVGFSQTKDLEILLFTDATSRKALNIAQNNKVAMTIASEKDLYTVQLEGGARVLSDDEVEPLEANHFQKMPFTAKLKGTPGRIPILIKPTHLRFTDITVRPWALTEF